MKISGALFLCSFSLLKNSPSQFSVTWASELWFLGVCFVNSVQPSCSAQNPSDCCAFCSVPAGRRPMQLQRLPCLFLSLKLHIVQFSSLWPKGTSDHLFHHDQKNTSGGVIVFFSKILLRNYSNRVNKFHNEQLFIYPLESTINILLHLSHTHPSIHVLIYSLHFLKTGSWI